MFRNLIVWFPDPSLNGRGAGQVGKQLQDLVNKLTLAQIRGYIPAISVDEGKNATMPTRF